MSSQQHRVVSIQETIVNAALLRSSLFSNNMCYLNITEEAHNHTLATKTRKCRTILGFAQCMHHVDAYIPFFFISPLTPTTPSPAKSKERKWHPCVLSLQPKNSLSTSCMNQAFLHLTILSLVPQPQTMDLCSCQLLYLT